MTQNRYLDETYFEGDIFALTAAILQWRALDQTLIKKSRKKSWSSKWKFAIIVIIRMKFKKQSLAKTFKKYELSAVCATAFNG